MLVLKPTALDFQPVSIENKTEYQKCLWSGPSRGCEYSFANLFTWGDQKLARMGDWFVIFSRFGMRELYHYPIGTGDRKQVLEVVFADARARGIEWRFSGLLEQEKEELEALYPDRFAFVANEGSFDYVYDVNDLADLAGRKYHGKRNHCKRFEDACPNYVTQPITEENLSLAKTFAEAWYAAKQAEQPDADYRMEEIAMERAFANYRALELDGLLLLSEGRVLAMTMGNRMNSDTFDVNFEKATAEVQGAYAMINREFARYIRQKYPEVRYLDREEDMGIEGLRQAKLSYYPHHQVKKYRAIPKEFVKHEI